MAQGATPGSRYDSVAVLEVVQTPSEDTEPGARLLKLANEAPSQMAWALASRSRRSLRLALDASVRHGAALHDRRLPRGGPKLDHVVVGAHGVFVVAVRLHVGRPARSMLADGYGWRLNVGGTDFTELADEVARQAHALRMVVGSAGFSEQVSVRPVLCLPNANWPLLGRPFRLDEVLVAPATRMGRLVRKRGSLRAGDVDLVSRMLDSQLSPARHRS